MNTTKIHIIARDLLAELKRVGTVSLLQQAIQALQQHISQPQQPNHQQHKISFNNNNKIQRALESQTSGMQ